MVRIYEIIDNWDELMAEDAESMAKIADYNIKAARRMKKTSQIKKTEDSLNRQKGELNNINSPLK